MQLLWIEFSTLTLLVALLVWSCWQRKRWRGQPESKAVLSPGHGFDTTAIKQHLIHLRQGQDAVAIRRSRNTPGHDFLVAAIRQSLTRLSYFRRPQTEALPVAASSARKDGG